jgi:hypothetical protein
VVVDDAAEAERLLRKGVDVVLIVAPGAPSAELEGRVPGRELPGRLAVLVGDASRSEVLEAAREMDREVFGRTGAQRPIIGEQGDRGSGPTIRG